MDKQKKKVWVGYLEEHSSIKELFDWGEEKTEANSGKYRELEMPHCFFNNKFYQGEKKIRITVEEL